MALFAISTALLSLGAALLAAAVWKLAVFLIKPYTSPLRDLPGPPNPSWLYGNFVQMQESGTEIVNLHRLWVDQYGNTLKYKGLMNSDQLYTVDPRAIGHVLSHSYDYPKPEPMRYGLGQILGEGILIVEGEQHRQQRRILNPAFGPAQIRELTEVFILKARQLSDIWAENISQSGQPLRLDVLTGLNKLTLDVIGLAGFNYNMDVLNVEGKPNELHEAFEVMFQYLSSETINILEALKALIPAFRIIPDMRVNKTQAAQKVMKRIGMKLIADKKAEVLEAARAGEKGKLQSRDLLTLLIKANMSDDVPENQRLSDEDVLAQVPTFLVAGHETTSNATTWCLFALAQAPEVQHKLREELLTVPTENPTMDELNELPYLDAVIRETMRVHAPVIGTQRIAGKDDVIPLQTPYTDVHGRVHDSIKVRKGSPVVIPILAMNRSSDLWGEDSYEFKPERWESLPEAVQQIPGVWGNMMSFLGGARACIGYRFSLVEMKALIFTLVRTFEFEPAVPADEIVTKVVLVQRPYVRSEMEKGCQMPLLVKPYVRS